MAHEALVEGGAVFLRTDDEDYFQQMLCVFAASPLFDRAETAGELSEVLTDFERGFRAKGVQTRMAAYIKHS